MSSNSIGPRPAPAAPDSSRPGQLQKHATMACLPPGRSFMLSASKYIRDHTSSEGEIYEKDL